MLICNSSDSSNCKSSKIPWPTNNKRAKEFRPSAILLPLCHYVIVLVCCCAMLLSFFYLCPYAIYQIVLIASFLRHPGLLIIKKLMNFDCRPSALLLPLCCCIIIQICYCATLLGLFYLRLHAIHQIVLIVNFLRYPGLLIMKMRINLDNLPCYCHHAIMLLCDTLLSFLYLCPYAIYQIVKIVSY